MSEPTRNDAQHVLNRALTGGLAHVGVAEQSTREPNPYKDLWENLEQLLHNNRSIELVMDVDGMIDVRSAGLAAYSRRLFDAVQARVQVEAARATDKLMGRDAAGAPNRLR